MYLFDVIANDLHLGYYIAEGPQDARDQAAKDAGYLDEADMVARLELPSELTTRAVVSVMVIMNIMHAEGVKGERDWEQGVTTYQYKNHRIVVDQHDVTIL